MTHFQHLVRYFAALLCICTACSDPSSRGDIRTMHYFPDGWDFVCLNGTATYNKALYGTNTMFRIETSDMPLFAAYDGNENTYNICLTINGRDMQNLSYCEARYQGGMRRYTLRDDAWGKGEMEITAMASFFEEGAIWQFNPQGFDEAPTIKALRRKVICKEIPSWGDIRVKPTSDFFSADEEDPGETVEWKSEGNSYLLYHNHQGMEWRNEVDGKEIYTKESAAQQKLANKVVFDTPDPFFNTLGSAIVASADGIWDEPSQTWLHGAIAWRMTYNGWRGGYAGDALGWSERSREHFRAFFKSMVTEVPQTMEHPQQDMETLLSRAKMEWGTCRYSNGYVGPQPGRNNDMSLYDMNLNFIDILLCHVCYDADPNFLRELWPYLVLHLDWEKRNFDPDNDFLYDACACIWASDALWYSSGAVTHSTAYNYRGNLLAARIAELIGEDPEPYKKEAEGILKAMNSRLWMSDMGCWAEYQDFMGLKRLHKSPALWTIYTPIDCGACTPEQAWLATRYVDECTPHIPINYRYDHKALKGLGLKLPKESKEYCTLSSSDWMPYVYSTTNVVRAEVANMAAAYFEAGRGDEGYRVMMGDILDGMYLSKCPGNLGMGSYYDLAIQEWFRDFGDNVGTAARMYVNTFFGIMPNALWDECFIQPAFPTNWDHAAIHTDYLSYSFRREGNKDIYEVEQHFKKPLQIVIRVNYGEGDRFEVRGTTEEKQTIVVDRAQLPEPTKHQPINYHKIDMNAPEYMESMGLSDIKADTKKICVDMSAQFNSYVGDIFRNDYLTPRSPYTTLQIPLHGVGDWCGYSAMYDIDDSGFRSTLKDNVFDTGLGVQFNSPKEGQNIAYTSLWDNYPDSLSVPLEGNAKAAYLLMAGSTNNMQSRIDNGIVRVEYADGSHDVMPLYNPVNWTPIEQDYHFDNLRFLTSKLHPYRVLFKSGKVMRDPTYDPDFEHVEWKPTNGTIVILGPRLIPCGAGQILRMPLQSEKELKSLTLTTLSNEVVIGLMGITLEE